MTSAEAIPYGTHQRQIVQVYRSHTAFPDRPSPLLIFIHGGAWKDGKIQDHEDLAKYISEHADVAVALVEYRLSLPDNDFRHPVHINDFHAALSLLWDTSTSARYHYNPLGAILVGHSVGGWMTLSAALASEEAIDDGPVADMPAIRSDILKQVRAFVAVASIFSLVGLATMYPSYSSFLIPAFYAPEIRSTLQPPYEELHKAGVESWPLAPAGSYYANDEPSIHVIHSIDDELLNSTYNEEGIALLRAKGLQPVIDLISCTGKHDDMLHTETFWHRLISIVDNVM